MAAEKHQYTKAPQTETEDGEPPAKNCALRWLAQIGLSGRWLRRIGLSARHLQALILFLSLTVGYTMRAQLSVTIVAMTAASKNTFEHITPQQNTSENMTMQQNTTTNYEMVDDVQLNVTSNSSNDTQANSTPGWDVYRTYSWNKRTQEMILFSFFVGYTGMMLPMGALAQRFGGKRPIMVALGANALLSIATPSMAMFGGWMAVCACRVLQGATQAAFFPSIHTILGQWAPVSERGRLSTYIYTGSQFGTIVAFQLAGAVCGSPTLGWPVVFWLLGGAALLCLLLYSFLGAASPHDHKTISAAEFEYITAGSCADTVPKKRRVPWRQILRNKAIWGVVATHAGSAMGYLFILTQIPLYMNKILHVDMKQNGLFSSLPYIAMYLTSLLFGFLGDLCVTKKLLAIVNVRRTFNSIGMILASVFLVWFSFVQNTLLAVALLILCLGLHSGVHCGFFVNMLDLTPNFAGPLMSLSNMLANLSSLLVPVFTTNVVGDDTWNQGKWQIMFALMAAIQVLTGVVFAVCASGDVQPWNFEGEIVDEKNNLYQLVDKNSSLLEKEDKIEAKT